MARQELGETRPLGYYEQHILSDGVDNALSGGAQSLPLRPAHLLEQAESLVLCGELVLLAGWLWSCRPASSEDLNSVSDQTRPGQ